MTDTLDIPRPKGVPEGFGALALGFTVGESLVIRGADCSVVAVIQVIAIKGDKVRLVTHAPSEMPVNREALDRRKFGALNAERSSAT